MVNQLIAAKPAMEITARNESKILQAVWGDLNRTVLTANEDGTVRIYDVRVCIYLPLIILNIYH